MNHDKWILEHSNSVPFFLKKKQKTVTVLLFWNRICKNEKAVRPYSYEGYKKAVSSSETMNSGGFYKAEKGNIWYVFVSGTMLFGKVVIAASAAEHCIIILMLS